MIIYIRIFLPLFVLLSCSDPSLAGFKEKFEDGEFSTRGWYDNTNLVLSLKEAAPGSKGSAEFIFLQGKQQPISGGAMRRIFKESESVYLSYYVKYCNNWQGSKRKYHPHEFYIVTNKDSRWVGPARSYLTVYIEQLDLKPRFAIQDSKNIDINNIHKCLVDYTEKRSVAGCNGDSDNYGFGDCYNVGDVDYRNSKNWTAKNADITTGKWHKIETFIRLNSVKEGIGKADGIMKYWLNGQLIMNYNDVVFRTGQHPDMKFNQLLIAPWIGDGSPTDQTFWVGKLVLSFESPYSNFDIILDASNRPSHSCNQQ